MLTNVHFSVSLRGLRHVIQHVMSLGDGSRTRSPVSRRPILGRDIYCFQPYTSASSRPDRGATSCLMIFSRNDFTSDGYSMYISRLFTWEEVESRCIVSCYRSKTYSRLLESSMLLACTSSQAGGAGTMGAEIEVLRRCTPTNVCSKFLRTPIGV